MAIQQAAGPVPVVTLSAIGHGRKLTMNALGAPALLIFAGRETQDQMEPVRDAVRERYATPSEAMICNIADVRGIPRLVRKVAEQMMKSSYKNAVDKLAPGKSPEDYVLILPDWDGALFNACAIEEVSKQIAVAAIDRGGNIAGVYQGDGPAAAALQLLAGIAG